MILSLAQKIVPTVIQRLQYQDEIRNQSMLQLPDHEQFAGDCTPLGHTEGVEADSSSSSLRHLKTTGLDQPPPSRDVEMGDPSSYLPESAALLITALSNSAKKSSRRNNSNNATTTADESLDQFPCLLDEALDGESETGDKTFDYFEKEAEALLQSIQNEDGTTHPTIADDGMSSMDDDDSIGGDIVRLSRSIAFLQHDLDNVDISHFDGFEDDFDGEGNISSAWSRMKLWFSRGMIMEQKLLNTVNGMGDEGGEGVNVGSRYAENPVLFWSMAIMWAFLLLIMGHSKIAEWVEGEDPGRLVDVIEWIFS
jgi:hypothetical protein